MFICEGNFTQSPADPEHPEFALHETDLYGHIPIVVPINSNHRLSIRYNLITQQFEIYKSYYPDIRTELIWHSANFEATINRANEIVKEVWGEGWGNDKVCQHEPMNKAHGCRIYEAEKDAFARGEAVFDHVSEQLKPRGGL